MTAGTDALAAWQQHLEEAIGVADEEPRTGQTHDPVAFEFAMFRDVLCAVIRLAEHRFRERLQDELRKQLLAIYFGVPVVFTVQYGLLQLLL